MVFAAFDVFTARVCKDGMMQPHACVGICGRSIGVYEVGLHPSDKAVLARNFCLFFDEVLHTVVDMARWNFVGAISDLYPLRIIFSEVLRLEMCYF